MAPGGVVAELEAEIGRLLGKPAAAYLPSGTMAQQAVLRVHADTRHRRTVLFHPMCHLDRHEEQAYQRLHGLTGLPVGDLNRLLTLADLGAVSEPAAALLSSCRSATSAASSRPSMTCAPRSRGRMSAARRRTWTGRGCGSRPPGTGGRPAR